MRCAKSFSLISKLHGIKQIYIYSYTAVFEIYMKIKPKPNLDGFKLTKVPEHK